MVGFVSCLWICLVALFQLALLDDFLTPRLEDGAPALSRAASKSIPDTFPFDLLLRRFLTELAKLPPSANQVQQMPAEADASEASNNADSDEKRKDQ